MFLAPHEPGNRTVVPIPRLLNVEDYLDYVTNRVLPGIGGARRSTCVIGTVSAW